MELTEPCSEQKDKAVRQGANWKAESMSYEEDSTLVNNKNDYI